MYAKICLIILLLITLAILLQPKPANAAKFINNSTVTIHANEVINDDVYASGGTIMVKGIINGDLVTAGGNIDMQGTVNGDIIAAGGSININGTVQDDIRVAGGNINITSSIGGDAILAGGSTLIGGSIAGDLAAASGALEITGIIAGNADLASEETTINGTIRGNVKAQTHRQLTIGHQGHIGGNLDYSSRHEISLKDDAQILGNTTRTKPYMDLFGVSVQVSPLTMFAGSLVLQTRWFLGVTLVGLLLLWLFPRAIETVAKLPLLFPWRSLGMGLTVLITAPVPFIFAGILSIILGGFTALPILLVPGVAYFTLLALAGPVMALLMGEFIFKKLKKSSKPHGWKPLLLGAALLALIGLVPILNVAVAMLTVLFGFGAWILYLHRCTMQRTK